MRFFAEGVQKQQIKQNTLCQLLTWQILDKQLQNTHHFSPALRAVSFQDDSEDPHCSSP
jgi:hypothetical protein